MAKTKNDTKSIEITSEKPKNAKKLQKQAQKVSKSKFEIPEVVHVYHSGDDLEKVSRELTGRSYMEYAVLNYSGLNMNTLKDGDILKWGL